jgi:hypothetical protein
MREDSRREKSVLRRDAEAEADADANVDAEPEVDAEADADAVVTDDAEPIVDGPADGERGWRDSGRGRRVAVAAVVDAVAVAVDGGVVFVAGSLGREARGDAERCAPPIRASRSRRRSRPLPPLPRSPPRRAGCDWDAPIGELIRVNEGRSRTGCSGER